MDFHQKDDSEKNIWRNGVTDKSSINPTCWVVLEHYWLRPAWGIDNKRLQKEYSLGRCNFHQQKVTGNDSLRDTQRETK